MPLGICIQFLIDHVILQKGDSILQLLKTYISTKHIIHLFIRPQFIYSYILVCIWVSRQHCQRLSCCLSNGCHAESPTMVSEFSGWFQCVGKPMENNMSQSHRFYPFYWSSLEECFNEGTLWLQPRTCQRHQAAWNPVQEYATLLWLHERERPVGRAVLIVAPRMILRMR